MKRLLWLGAGLAIGALVVRAVSKKARSYTPRGIAGAAAASGRNLLDAARDFVDDVRDGMHEREQELRAGFVDGVDPDADLADLDAEMGRPAGDYSDGKHAQQEHAQDVLARHPPEGPTR